MAEFKNRNTDTAKANARRTELADEFALKIVLLVMEDLRYDLFANNLQFTEYQIAKILNSKGYKTRFGKLWQQNSVRAIFDRVFKLGVIDWTRYTD